MDPRFKPPPLTNRSSPGTGIDGSTCDRGPCWYFHEGGKRKKLYLGKTDEPKGELERRRKAGSGGAGQI